MAQWEWTDEAPKRARRTVPAARDARDPDARGQPDAAASRPPGKKGAFSGDSRPHRRAHAPGAGVLAPLAFMPLRPRQSALGGCGALDLDYHIRSLHLPKPGTQVQLEEAVAKLHEGMLDRDRPLWQFTVIDGLKSGQVGFYAKIHHAALDGQGGIAVAQALLDTQPKPRAAAAVAAQAVRTPPTIGEDDRRGATQYRGAIRPHREGRARRGEGSAGGATVLSTSRTAQARPRPSARARRSTPPSDRSASSSPRASRSRKPRPSRGTSTAKLNDVVLATVRRRPAPALRGQRARRSPSP